MKTKTVALALLLTTLGVAGCSDQKEEPKEEVMAEMEKAGEATADTYEDAKEKAADSWDKTKDATSDAYEDGKEMASELIQSVKSI